MDQPLIRDAQPESAGDLMRRVEAAMAERGLSARAAAALIGVGQATLEKHLAGEHVRSDSAVKYENWLEGRPPSTNVFVLTPRPIVAEEDEDAALPTAPIDPHLVVDIFSGCGGLSLGFDLLGGGEHFRTILAVDNQAAPIAVLNRNAQSIRSTQSPIGRQMDLTEFSNEVEFLAFFVEHVAAVENGGSTAERLARLAHGAFPEFRRGIAAIDAGYLHDLNAARATPEWQAACLTLDRECLGQTSVAAFHEQLRLPRPGLRDVALPVVLWGDPTTAAAPCNVAPGSALLEEAEGLWDRSVQLLAERQATGRGQLSASARRVALFVGFLGSPAMAAVRSAWTRWRARRNGLRAGLFENPVFAAQLRALYGATYPISVLVGGPPCQGFSRIGRGKIRSLREASVHAQGDPEAGDIRNLLFRQYVMVLEALRPKVFLFENVQHFQSTVKAEGVEFQATEVLAEAIANMSDGEVSYEVDSGTLDASRHGVPQTRQRYFMCGVRADSDPTVAARHAADVLTLPRRAEVPLSAALAGLPQPHLVGGDAPASRGKHQGDVAVSPAACHSGFTDWIRQPPPGRPASDRTDGHIARTTRSDDAAFFGLMGPGKRWMDYRSDDAPTLAALRDVVTALLNVPDEMLAPVREAAKRAGQPLPSAEVLSDLEGRLDGSIPLRLLLEQIGENLGTPHHLLSGTYLAKRDGWHGDWVARMDARRPAKTMVSHMGKDTYGYVHPADPRTISVREAARIQTFPDWFSFGGVALTDAFKMVGNAVPPLLSHRIATKVAVVLADRSQSISKPTDRARSRSSGPAIGA